MLGIFYAGGQQWVQATDSGKPSSFLDYRGTITLENINIFSVYLNISSQFVFSVILWVLNIDIPTHTSETKEVKMTAPV